MRKCALIVFSVFIQYFYEIVISVVASAIRLHVLTAGGTLLISPNKHHLGLN